jgi:hypothetical protein
MLARPELAGRGPVRRVRIIISSSSAYLVGSPKGASADEETHPVSNMWLVRNAAKEVGG